MPKDPAVVTHGQAQELRTLSHARIAPELTDFASAKIPKAIPRKVRPNGCNFAKEVLRISAYFSNKLQRGEPLISQVWAIPAD